MTRKTLHALIAIVVGLLLLLLAIRGNDVDDSTVSGPALLPDFRAVANDVAQVRVVHADADEGVTLHLEDDRWVVNARDGYLADVGKLRQLIIALANAEILEEKTSNPEQYDKLGVGDPEEGGNGTKVVITAPQACYEVVLGNAAQGQYRYARLASSATSYLIDQNPDLPLAVGDWLLPDILDIDAEKVKRVAITHADGETIVIEKTDQEQTDFDVSNVPDGRELSYATVGNGIAGALGNLELDDVRKRVEAPAITTAVYETWDGLRVSAEVFSEEETTWIAFSAEPSREDSTADERVAEINERLSGWQYQLPDYKKNLLVRRWDDILKATD